MPHGPYARFKDFGRHESVAVRDLSKVPQELREVLRPFVAPAGYIAWRHKPDQVGPAEHCSSRHPPQC